MKTRDFDVLKELSNFSSMLIISKHVAYVIFDADGYLITVNEAARTLSFDLFDSIMPNGLHISEFKPKAIAEIGLELMEKSKTEYSVTKEVDFKRISSGQLVTILCRVTAVRNKENELNYFMASFNDITETIKTKFELISAEANLLAVLNSSTDQILIVDVNLSVILFNDSLSRAIKRVQNKTIEIGKKISDFLLESDKVSFERYTKQALAGKTVSAERKLISERGNESWIEINASPIRNPEDEINTVLISYKNITERKKAELALIESETKLNIIFTSGQQCFILLDLEGSCLLFNPNAERFLTKYCQLVPEIGKALKIENNPKFLNHIKRGIEAAKNGGTSNFEEEFKDLDGTFRYFSIQFNPVNQDKIRKVKMWIVDINDRKKAELLLRKSEETLKSIFNNTNQTFYLLNRILQIEDLNKAAIREINTQYKVVPQLGDQIQKFISPDRLAKELKSIELAFAGKQIVEESQVLISTGIKWFERHYNPIANDDGQINFVTIWSLDITERKEIEEALIVSEKKFRTLSNLSPVGIYQTDENLQIIYTNNKLSEIFQLNSQALIEQQWLLAIHPDDQKKILTIKEKATTNLVEYFVEYRVLSKTKGEIIYIYEKAVPLFERKHQFLGYLSCVVDITEHIESIRMKSEQELLEKTNKYKSDFLAGMSHEIRTPLTTILGYTELLSNSELNIEQNKHLNTIDLAAKNLKGIVNDILDLSKLDAGKGDWSMDIFSIQEVLDETLDAFKIIAQKKDLELFGNIELDGVKFIKTNKRRVIQILSNLTNNAIKFTQKGKVEISIIVNTETEKNCIIRFEVMDTGNGILAEDLPKLFTEYSQISTSGNFTEGTGLGLLISKRLANMLGGEMGVESKFGIGSTFWFTIAAEIVTDLKPNPNLSHTKEQNYSILVAEDNALNRLAFVKMLEKLGNKVVAVKNGSEVVKQFEIQHFDLVFMDIQMPELDGIETIKLLRNTYTSLPPIIGLSGIIEQNASNFLQEIGMDDFLSKPINSEDFTSKINKWLSNSNPS